MSRTMTQPRLADAVRVEFSNGAAHAGAPRPASEATAKPARAKASGGSKPGAPEASRKGKAGGAKAPKGVGGGAKKPKAVKTKREASDGAPMAARLDRHVLYEHSVQAVDAEIDFVDDTYKDLRGRRARSLREDFCGTANTSCEWVRRRATNVAVGVDLDAGVLEWGRKHNVARLKPAARRRVSLRNENVLTVRTDPTDIVLAMNFSYWIFKTRDQLREYFRSVRDSLAPGGVFFMDSYGGSDAHREVREKRTIDECVRGGFTYVWDQARYDPITGEMQCHIHFHFPDGSKMNRAFSYNWRLWTLPEIRELLAEAGFARSTVYWEGTEEDTGEGDGEFTPAEHGEADPAWICYIVAEK